MTQRDYTVLRGEIANLEIQQINVHYVKDSQRQKKMAGLSAALQAAAGQPGAVHSAQFLFATIGLSWGDFMAFSRKMDRVGKALGIARPAQIDLFKSTKQARKAGRPPLPMGVYYY